VHADCNLSFIFKDEGVFTVIVSHVHFKSISGMELDRDTVTTDIIYGLRKSSKYDDLRRINFEVICQLKSFSNGMFCSCRIYTDLYYKLSLWNSRASCLSPWSWLTILGWIASGAAIVLVVILRIKVRSLTVLLLARTAHAVPFGTLLQLPKVLSLTTSPPVTKPALDVWAEWTCHAAHVSNLLPAEFWCFFVWSCGLCSK